jgi:hypothetical protein
LTSIYLYDARSVLQSLPNIAVQVTIERVRDMRRRFYGYTAYSIGCAIVWAVILAVVSSATDSATRHKLMLVFGGWVIGWLSATIARTVYPPLKWHLGP